VVGWHVASRSTGSANACPRALELRVNAVGGAPHIDPEHPTSSRPGYALAAGCGRPVDLHMDEHLRSSVDVQDLVRVTAAGFPQPVTKSHLASLGMRSAEVQDMLAPVVARAGIAVGTCTARTYICSDATFTATPRGLTAPQALLGAGVLGAGGSDDVQDLFIRSPAAAPGRLRGCSCSPASSTCGPAYRLSENARAVLGGRASGHAGRTRRSGGVAGCSMQEAVATTTEDRIVFRAPRVVCRTRVVPERTRYHQTQEVPMPESVDPLIEEPALTMDSQRRKIDAAPWP
jgi:cytosine/creatinine deaminase